MDIQRWKKGYKKRKRVKEEPRTVFASFPKFYFFRYEELSSEVMWRVLTYETLINALYRLADVMGVRAELTHMSIKRLTTPSSTQCM